jgi:hypothetical protein
VACPQALGERPALSYRRSFLKSFLVLEVLFLVPRPACLELHLPAPEKLAHSVGMRVLDAAFAQEPMSLPDRCYLSLLHGLLEFFEGFERDQLLAAAFVYPAFEQRLQTASPVAGEPPLALAPTVVQSVSSLFQITTGPRFQEL